MKNKIINCVLDTKKRMLATDEIKPLACYSFYWLFECKGKRFFILNDIWSNMGHPYSNKDIRDDRYGVPFEMWNGENYILEGVPCLGTLFHLEGLDCWNYNEVSSLGWSKGFYRKVVTSLQKRFEGYYGFDVDGDVFCISDYIVLGTNNKYEVFSKDTEIGSAYLMQIGNEYNNYTQKCNNYCVNDAPF